MKCHTNLLGGLLWLLWLQWLHWLQWLQWLQLLQWFQWLQWLVCCILRVYKITATDWHTDRTRLGCVHSAVQQQCMMCLGQYWVYTLREVMNFFAHNGRLFNDVPSVFCDWFGLYVKRQQSDGVIDIRYGIRIASKKWAGNRPWIF